MAKRILISLAGVLVAGQLVLHSLNAAPPPCGKHPCSAAIAACQSSECSGLSGKSASQCKKDCVDAVQAACQSDNSICGGGGSPSAAFID